MALPISKYSFKLHEFPNLFLSCYRKPNDKNQMTSGHVGVLNPDKERYTKTIILILQSVFLGIFAGSFDIGAQTIFIDVYGSTAIPGAFAWSGAVGIFITAVYSFLQSRMNFTYFSLLNFFFVILCSLGLRIGFEFTGDPILVFAMFVLMGPLTIITFLGFWGTVSRMFTLRQGKSVFGLIDSGQILGMILSFYAIPILLTVGFRILDTLYVCASGILIAFIIQIILFSRFKISQERILKPKAEKRSFPLFNLLGNRYTRLMVLFVGLSVFAAFFIHFSFLSVTEANYPEPKGLASFLGLFMGTVMVLTLIIKTLLYNRLIKTYGIRLALLISPVIIGIFVFLAIAAGNRYGYSVGSAGFTIFFLFIVSAKLFSKSLKDAVEVPSSKILYHSLDQDLRFDVQARIDGTVNEMAAFSAGLLMAGLSLSHFSLMHFQYVLAGILVLWLVTGISLYRAYKLSLKLSLRRYLEAKDEPQRNKSIKHARLVSTSIKPGLARVLDYFPQTWNGFLTRNLEKLLDSDEEEVSAITLDWISKFNITESKNLLISHEERVPGARKLELRSLIDRFRGLEREMDTKQIRELIRSENPEERLRAIAVLLKELNPVEAGMFLPLLRDSDFYVKASAIRAVGLLRLSDIAPYLIDLLDDPSFYPFVYGALTRMSEDIMEKLELAANKTDISEKKLHRLISIMTESHHPDTGEIFLRLMNTRSIAIKAELIKRLLFISYKVNESAREGFIRVIYEMSAINAWNTAILYSIVVNRLNTELVDALESEIETNMEIIFDILSLIYDPQLIFQIRKNLQGDSSEGNGFAMELLDLFMDDELKAWLFPLLEDNSLQSRVQNLQAEFPVHIFHASELINKILNRDYNKISPSVKMLAMKHSGSIDNYHPGNDLKAHLFNPDIELSVIAAEQLILTDIKLLEEAASRLPKRLSDNVMDHMASLQAGRPNGIYDKFKILKDSGIYPKVNQRQLYRLASEYRILSLHAGGKIRLNERQIANSIIYIFQGELYPYGYINDRTFPLHSFFSVRDLIRAYGINASLISEKESVILVLDENILKEFIFDYEFEFDSVPGLMLNVTVKGK